MIHLHPKLQLYETEMSEMEVIPDDQADDTTGEHVDASAEIATRLDTSWVVLK